MQRARVILSFSQRGNCKIVRSGLKAPAEPSRAELPTRRVKFLFPKTSSEEINHKYFLYKIIT